MPTVPMLPPPAYDTPDLDAADQLHLDNINRPHLSPNGNPRYECRSHQFSSGGRPRAALIAQVHESEPNCRLSSISRPEEHFNHQFLYDWVFVNKDKFSDEFKEAASNITGSQCMKILRQHWRLPSWISSVHFQTVLELMDSSGTFGKWSLGDHCHMSRWNVGSFAWENRLEDYDWLLRTGSEVGPSSFII